MKGEKQIKKYIHKAMTDDLLYSLLEIGVVGVLASAPWLAVISLPFVQNTPKRRSRRQVQNTLDYARRRGYVHIESRRGRVSITLTEKGRQKAATSFVRATPIRKTPSQWDNKWRVLMYDIAESKRLKRDVLRDFIRRSGFVKLQGSIWIYPYDCTYEVQKLKSYLQLSDEECRLMIGVDISEDAHYRKKFGLT